MAQVQPQRRPAAPDADGHVPLPDWASTLGQHALAAAPNLVGCTLSDRHGVMLRITEVEAYGAAGSIPDPASHAFRGPGQASAAMFGPPGTAYVYRSYGIHLCLNIVCGPLGHGGGVLVRAGEVSAGEELVRARRHGRNPLASGPGNVGAALAVSLADNGTSVFGGGPLQLRGPDQTSQPAHVRSGPRIGISRAVDLPWRFWDADSSAVTRYRPPPRSRKQRP